MNTKSFFKIRFSLCVQRCLLTDALVSGVEKEERIAELTPPLPPLARAQALRAFLISVSQVKSRRVLRCHAVGLSGGGSFGAGEQREQSKRFTPRGGRDRPLARKGRENKPTGNAQGARRGGV